MDDNIKMDIVETIFVIRLDFYYNTGRAKFLEMIMRLICI